MSRSASGRRRGRALAHLPADLVIGSIDVERTKIPAHGDVASNAAMAPAKAARAKPRDIAEKLAAEDRGGAAAVAGPGFVNITPAPATAAERGDVDPQGG